MFFNYKLPNNHSPQSGRIRLPKVNYKIYNSALNNKHINITENNQPLKRRHAPTMLVCKIVKTIKKIVKINVRLNI